MSDEKKPPPTKDESSAFKRLLGKLAKVPKAEVEQKEREYQEARKRVGRRKAGA